MKTLRLCGWAVIFTVTLLLAACASHDPRVADSDVMSGPDTTMSQTGMQMHEDSAIVISQDWLDERERAVEQRELALDRHEDSAIVISQDWLDGRETAVEQRELDLELLDNALVIQQAWHKERALQLDLKEFDLERQGNSLAIQQAWLNERETRLAQSVPDLTKQDDMIAFRQALVSGRVMSLEKTVSRTAGSVKLAGADSSLDKAVSSTTRIEGGQCYAKVIFPAEYKTVAVIKPIDVPKGENLPTLYQTVIEKVKVTDEQMRWEEILCEEKMTECRIIEVQRALDQGGYNPGPIDGIVGQQTIAAVNAFQKDFNLTVANYLTIETVKALDANF